MAAGQTGNSYLNVYDSKNDKGSHKMEMKMK